MHFLKTLALFLLTSMIWPAFADIYDSEQDISQAPDEQPGFSLPPMEMEGDAPLPNQSTGKYPAGTQPAQPWTANQATQNPLIIHLDLDFINALGDEVTLEYQYFYNDVRRPPWKGQIILRNESADQTVQIQRGSVVARVILFLRPAGAGSTECIPAGGQSPVVFNEVKRVELIGRTDASNNFTCQLRSY